MMVFTFNGFLSPQEELKDILDPVLKPKKSLGLAVCDESQYQEILGLGGNDYLQGLVRLISSHQDHERIAVGYSLGGRILLQLLLRQSNLFNKVIFVSTHPGLSSDADKHERLQSDFRWTEKIDELGLPGFMQQWNAQPVLANSRMRSGDIFKVASAPHIKSVLTHFSLGYQPDMRPLIHSLQVPQLWIAGKADMKFVNLHQGLLAPNITQQVIANAGHRVHQDQPEAFCDSVFRYLSNFD